jgi:hypothetical protein
MSFIVKNLKKLRKYFNWLIIKKENYTPLSKPEYYKRFKIELNSQTLVYEAKDEKLLEKAYTKAWENRDFEIDKFWTRAAYFWGFIVLIFGGYITILTGEHTTKALNMHLDLFLLLLGLLFSISWYLVILGSKCWQRNWEAHIDHLENFVSGPLYKTIYFSGNRFYSVSKLNEVMAIVVIVVWAGLFGQYLFQNYSFTVGKGIDYIATIAIGLTIIFAIVLTFGYSSGSYKSTKHEFIDRWE